MQLSEADRSRLVNLKTDFSFYAPRCLKIKTKSGELRPFVMNRAQQFIHGKVEEQLQSTGKIRALIVKGRQQGCCYAPWMRVLTADYRWVAVGDIEVGEKLYAVDENLTAGKVRRVERRTKVAVVEAKVELRRKAYEVRLSNGAVLTVTGEHRHLCRQRGGDYAQWRRVSDMRIGDHIRSFCYVPADLASTYEDGWFGGLLDGEGSFGASPGVRIGVSQVNGPVLDRAKAYLKGKGIRYYELIDRRGAGVNSKLGGKEVHCLRVDRMSDIIRLLSLTRPARFVDKPLFVGKKLPKTCPGFEAWARVISITEVGEIDVVDLQTSEKTYICEGVVSHNSTYWEGRFYWRTTMNFGKRAYILTHLQEATDNLFGMTRRYHDNVPGPFKPHTSQESTKALTFDKLGSEFSVATAGSKSTGRSATAQYFHGSEAAFWEDAQEHMAGIGQIIPNEAGTEMAIESTANGIGNWFYSAWQDAIRKRSDYIPIFVPWFWQPEYSLEPGEAWEPEPGTFDYIERYGLTRAQGYWRERKLITDFRGDEALFDQEYPATSALAFRRQAAKSVITIAAIERAMNRSDLEAVGPRIVGIDPADEGDGDNDDTVFVCRQGRVVIAHERHSNKRPMEVVGLAAAFIKKWEPEFINVDAGGLGSGIADRLAELNYPITRVLFGETAYEMDTYHLRRDEMWGELKRWFEQPVQIPYDEAAMVDLAGPTAMPDSRHRFKLESKKQMRSRGLKSPDYGDALALTFAVPAIAPKLMRSSSHRAYNWRVS